MNGKINQFGVIGLGRMGGGLALRALEKGWQVCGFTVGSASQELMAIRIGGIRSRDQKD